MHNHKTTMAKSTFKSYLIQQELEEARTFKSYVTDAVNLKSAKANKDKRIEDGVSSTDFMATEMEPKLLPGERVIAQATRVLRYSSFTEKKQGMSGALFVTNFKITFITTERSALNSTSSVQRDRNLIIGDMDVPLTGIDTIYQGFSGGKRKKISPGSTISSKTKYLYVYCKNLRFHQFSFKFTPKEEDKQIINAIVLFAFPNRSDLLFALQYSQQVNNTDWMWYTEYNSNIPTFTNHEDWERELVRLGCNGWLCIQANSLYSLCQSLPEYFVIPHSVVVAELREASKFYVDYRVPVWSYCVKTGAALVRMAYITPDCEPNDHENRFVTAMIELQPSGSSPTVFDLGKRCPTVRDIQHSFDALKDILITDSLKEYWMMDIAWNTKLEATHWLQNVQSCLKVASEVVSEMTQKSNSVIIKENTGRDLCCVVSSLVQIMLDPHYRSIRGFQSLVEKEWVAMGHPFQTHHNILKFDHTHQSPVFLLFLDCVWQLLQQFVSSFEFTETYLVSLWDSVHLGLFENFLFNSMYERDRFCGKLQQGHSHYAIHLPSVWNWSLQYDEEDISLFKNPLYCLNVANNLFMANDSKKDINGTQSTVSQRDYALKLNSTQDRSHDVASDCILRPKLGMSVLKLWKLCYLRWLAPGEIVNGGSQSGYLQQCLLVEEILDLQYKVEVMFAQSSSARRPESRLIFGQDNVNKSQLLRSSMITSSFPYSPVSPRGQQSVVFMPLISYLDKSTIRYDYTDFDD